MFSKKGDRNHLLWTDDHLAAFAQAIDLELVTLDSVLKTRYSAVRVIDLLQWSWSSTPMTAEP